MDMTHVQLTNGRIVEVLNVIDDHSRRCLASRAFPVTTAADVVATFYAAAASSGVPASVLSDNGAIFTASFRGDRGALSTELARRGIIFKHSRPYHPQTCGKVATGASHQPNPRHRAGNREMTDTTPNTSRDHHLHARTNLPLTPGPSS
ncbi:MAG: DDE-type integrase/transposase/recombinase [Acidimicrobiia bacterium]